MSGYRPVYTTDEDNIILKFIIDTEGYYIIRGKLFWEDLENTGLIDRSWQSLKERFEKHILPRINDSRYTISAVEKRSIELAQYQLNALSNISCSADEEGDSSDSNANSVIDSDSEEPTKETEK